MEELIVKLYNLGIIKISKEEKVTFSSGIRSPIYIDLRAVVSFPLTFKNLINLYSEKITDVDLIAGVPSGAIPIATGVSINLNLPMIVPRLETKKYGLSRQIEGSFEPGNRVCIIEDIVTTGKSVLKVKKILEDSGLKVVQIISFMNYPNSKRIDFNCRSFQITSLEDILSILNLYEIIDRDTWADLLSVFQPFKPASLEDYPDFIRSMVVRKRSQLIVALDVPWEECKELITILSPFVCAFKFHYDLLYQSDSSFDPEELMRFAKRYDFLVIRDRKTADVSKTNKAIVRPHQQDITIVHSLPGISSFPEGYIIPVLDMSTEDNLFSSRYIRSTLIKTQSLPNVIGYISQHKWWKESSKLCLTPGLDLESRVEKTSKQRYSKPEDRRRFGTDLFIVGSAITKSDNPMQKAEEYRYLTWYLN